MIEIIAATVAAVVATTVLSRFWPKDSDRSSKTEQSSDMWAWDWDGEREHLRDVRLRRKNGTAR